MMQSKCGANIPLLRVTMGNTITTTSRVMEKTNILMRSLSRDTVSILPKTRRCTRLLSLSRDTAAILPRIRRCIRLLRRIEGS